MSVSKWAYEAEKCDICIGDCDLCPKKWEGAEDDRGTESKSVSEEIR